MKDRFLIGIHEMVSQIFNQSDLHEIVNQFFNDIGDVRVLNISINASEHEWRAAIYTFTLNSEVYKLQIERANYPESRIRLNLRNWMSNSNFYDFRGVSLKEDRNFTLSDFEELKSQFNYESEEL